MLAETTVPAAAIRVSRLVKDTDVSPGHRVRRGVPVLLHSCVQIPVCSTRIPTWFLFLFACVLQLWPSRRKQRTAFANHFIIVPASQKGDTIYMKFLDTGKEQIARARANRMFSLACSSGRRQTRFICTHYITLTAARRRSEGGATCYENLLRRA